MKFIGLTGGIGSGKTTVAQFFQELGVPVYNSDARAKYLMETLPELKIAIKNLLGKEAYHDERLNKNYISERVFNNPPLLERLNAIVHPAVRSDFLAWTKEQNSPYVIQEAAVIFEIGSQDFYDSVILVTAPEPIRIERLIKRNPGTSPEDIRARMNHQMSDTVKLKKADIHLENIDLSETKSKVRNIHLKLVDEL